MIVKMPMMSVEARGTVGGLTYNTWKGINYVKTCTSPTGQGTEKRLAAQALLIAIAKLWQTLSDAERLAWNVYAGAHPVTSWAGPPKHLTGMNWFVKCNIQLARMSLPHRHAAPNLAAPDPITGLVVSAETTYLKIAWTTPATGEFNMDFWVVGPQSQGISAKLEKAQFLCLKLPTDFAGALVIAGCTAGRYTAFCRVLCRNTGLVSSWLSGFEDFS